MPIKKNVILEKSFDFALSVIGLYKILLKKKEFILSKQILRSGTSIGANVEEAVQAESRKDFIHKLSISLKEAKETHYWLRLLHESQLVEYDFSKYLEEADELIRILTAIIKSAKQVKPS